MPVPLIDFNKVKDDNWDITAQRVRIRSSSLFGSR